MSWSRAEPSPVPTRAYRYSKLRWRVLVRAFDALGALVSWPGRRSRLGAPICEPRRILVVQLDHLGDAVLSSPLFPRLRGAYPGARIDVLASPSNRALFEADPNVDRVVPAERNWFERRPGGWALGSAVWDLGRSLRGARYDLGIDVRGDVLSILVMALAGIPRRVGWAMGGGGFLLTDVADWVPGRHEVGSRLALLRCLGIADDGEPPRVVVHTRDRDHARVARLLHGAWPDRPARATPPRVRVGAGSHPRARSGPSLRPGRCSGSPDQMFPDIEEPDLGGVPAQDAADSLHAGRFGAAPLLAVHLGAGTAAKRWPSGHWQALLGRFLDDGWRVVIIGGPEDVEASRPIRPHPNLRDWTARLAITETAALLERADLFLGADSGPAHLAACAGVTSVVLFSGTNRQRQWRPWSRRALVLKQAVPCRPCHRKVCPLADHPCMSRLDPDRVYRASRRWWARMHRAESPHAPLGI